MKTRLLLVNNPITSLFMAAWFRQNRFQDDTRWRNVALYDTADYDEAFSEDIEYKKN